MQMYERITPYAGIVALAGLVGAAFQYALRHELDTVGLILLAVGVIGLIIFVAGNPKAIRSALGARGTRYGSNTVAIVLIFVAIAGVVNYMVAQHDQTWDVTANQQFTLSNQTIKLLKELKQPVLVTAFFSSQAYNRSAAEDLLQEYATRSDKIKLNFVDPIQDPAAALQYQITADGTTVFQMGARKETTTGTQESDFSGALLKLTSNQQTTVYFLTGQMERQLNGTDQNGYSQLKSALEQNNFKTATVDLTTQPNLDVNSSVLVVAAPTSALQPDEVKALNTYLNKGGKAFFLEDPGLASQSSEGIASLNTILKPYGVTIEDGVILDPGSSAAGSPTPNIPVIPGRQDPNNPITKDLGRTVFPAATSVTTAKNAPQGETIMPMLQTTAQSWLVRGHQDPNYNASTDLKGPLYIGALVDTPAKAAQGANAGKARTRIAVLGNSIFATNQFLRYEGNRDLFVDTLNWLSQSAQAISIPSKPTGNRQVFLVQADMDLIFWSSVAFLPGIVLAMGAFVWWKRR